MYAVESFYELANETSSGGGGRVVALWLFRVDARDDVCVEEGGDDVRFLDIKVMVRGQGEENA